MSDPSPRSSASLHYMQARLASITRKAYRLILKGIVFIFTDGVPSVVSLTT